jgi:hypothetical protein
MQRLSTFRYRLNTSIPASCWIVTDFSVAAGTCLAKPLTSDGRISSFQYSSFRQHVTLYYYQEYFDVEDCHYLVTFFVRANSAGENRMSSHRVRSRNNVEVRFPPTQFRKLTPDSAVKILILLMYRCRI